MALDLLKNTQLPNFLSKLSVYYHQYLALNQHGRAGQEQEVEELKQLRMELVADCRQLAAIRRKVPHAKRNSQMQLQVSPEQLNYLTEEWVSGKLRPGSPTTRLPHYGFGNLKISTSMCLEWKA
ncbi:hypothetical protein EDB80DRAFT_866452 [Ilyonectria destructans]|nr:hypothetical protein EDB80DRAFT_866452 [Ilyonectria destructans]